MRPLTQVQNPKQARWFPVNSTIRAVSTLAARSFRLPVYKRPSYQSGLQIARFANSARSRFGDDALARGWRSNQPQMGCVSWAQLSGLVSSDEAAVGRVRPVIHRALSEGRNATNVCYIVGYGHSAERRRLLDARSKIVGQPSCHERHRSARVDSLLRRPAGSAS